MATMAEDAPDEFGLSDEEARRRLDRDGPNALPEERPPSLPAVFARQFLSPFIAVLLVAAVVAWFFDQIPSAVFIGLVLLINAAIGAAQEYAAQRAAAALKAMVKGEVRVERDGQERSIPMDEVVVGDVMLLSGGDKVPADGRLLEADGVETDESMLTGESTAVAKDAGADVPDDAPLAERADMVFAGTTLTRGEARAGVVATALDSEIGRIAEDVTEREGEDPPLVQRIRSFTYVIGGGVLVAVAVLFAIVWLQGVYDREQMVLMVVGLAVSSIPEGLPAALTVALAIGMNRMAKANVVIRKLAAVEALGSCTFIGSDKTGTLTVNELTVRRLSLPDGTRAEVGGEGLALEGEIEGEIGDDALAEIVRAGVLPNDAELEQDENGVSVSGDMVDGAFLVLACKRGEDPDALRDEWEELREIPYESERAFAASLRRGPEGEARWFVKGAAEAVLEMCDRMLCGDGEADLDRERAEKCAEELAADGFRVLALASGGNPDADEPDGLAFLALAAMIDPLREEAADAVRRCREAGVRVAMITGDHPATAEAIARQLGLVGENGEEGAVSGSDLREMDDEQRAEAIRTSRVFARIEPGQKREIVETLIEAGHFVAVTGDGVNDAPALRAANCGVAMGGRGSDVARETADVIITDDDFSSIVKGVERGRIVYNNIRKVIALLIATGASEILLFFLCALTAAPLPLLPVQLLWLNLVTNGVQDVALAFEPAEGDELKRPPRRPDEPILDRIMIEHIAVNATWMAVVAYFTFQWFYDGTNEVEARNLTLMLMVLFGNVHAYASRSEHRSIAHVALFGNPFLLGAIVFAQSLHVAAAYAPWLSGVLELQPVALSEWAPLALAALTLFAVDEALKWRHRRLMRRE